MAGRTSTDFQAINLISLEEARRKCDEGHSSFTRVESVEHICLAPSFLGRVKVGVEEHLNKSLMKHSEKLQSVPVAYEGVQLMRRYGTVVEESPFIHFDVRVDFIVFKPTIGSTLVGIVNKMDFDHIGCLVHGSFNASIATSDYSNGYLFRELEMGSEFEFRVVGFEAVNGVFFIFGAIDDECHKRNRWKPLTEGVVAESSGHEIRSNEKVTRLSKCVVVKQEPEETPKKKRKTKCKAQDYSEINDELESSSRNSGKSEKKRKKRNKTM